MKRFVVAVVVVLLLGAAVAGLAAWLTRDPPAVERAGAAPADAAPPQAVALVELPPEAAARDVALATNEERRAFGQLAKGFGSAARTPASEARLLPALDVVFPRGVPRWSLECRRLLCRLEVDAPAAEWRAALAENPIARQQAERTLFDPSGGGLAFVELVEATAAEGRARPEGEAVLDQLEEALLASDAARGCVADGPGPGPAEVRLMVDRSGITYRFGSAVDSRVATCLMMRAMPDVVGGASAPAGVRRAERRVLVTAAR
ncbi:MAG TPA: hypothetical protein VFL83_02090 [Anaeromyxobacter sp.]|nr:hypothetical protein [Anaeromyxobacter sp.]